MSEEECFFQCQQLGFPDELIRKGIKLKGPNRDIVLNWLLDGANEPASDSDDRPPPLVSVDPATENAYGPPPYNPNPTHDVWANQSFPTQDNTHYRPATPPRKRQNSPNIAPFEGAEPTVKINNAGPGTEHFETIGKVLEEHKSGNEDEELQKAIQASLGVGTGTGGGGNKEDDEYNKAMEMSLASLDDVDMMGNTGSGLGMDMGGMEGSPESRVRQNDAPVAIRSSSPHLSGFTSFLQCLFHVPTWRHALLTFLPTEATLLNYPRPYTSYWAGNGPPLPLNHLDTTNPSHKRLLDLQKIHSMQRLFALLQESKRSYVSSTDVEFSLEIQEHNYKWGSDWSWAVKQSYTNLVEEMEKAEEARLREEGSEMSQGEIREQLKRLSARFSTVGREVANDKYIDMPLPALSDSDQKATSYLQINVDPSPPSGRPDDLFSALDRVLLTESAGGEIDQFSLLTVLPECIMIEIDRMRKEGIGAKKLFRLEERIWIDRYCVQNRKKIAENRERLKELKKEIEGVKTERNKLAWTKDGKDAVAGLETTLNYLKNATSDDPERSERQKMLATQYEIVLARLVSEIGAYDTTINNLEAESAAIWDVPEFKQQGPYKLCAILMRNGLNGRGSAWAVVRDEKDRWWKMGDTTAEEVTIDQVLQDPSGLIMDAGATMAFYQSAKAEMEIPQAPEDLKIAALRDNCDFAAQLPSEIYQSWDLGPRPPTPSYLPFNPADLPSLPTDDPPVPIELLSPPSPGMKVDEEPVMVEHLDLTKEKDEMVVDLDQLDTIPSDSEETLRLKGGATKGEDVEMNGDEEEEDDEEIDEDEVELGCLKAMPEKREEWDIDAAVGKVGGLPIWLDPTSPLEYKDVKCGVCGGVMSLLIQLNSPDDTRPHAAARAIYVFACTAKECLGKDSAKAIKVWRVQTPSPNAFYPHTPESLARRKDLETALDTSTALAGTKLEASRVAKPLPEWDVECESEPYEESFLAGAKVDNVGNAEDGTDDAAEPDTKVGVDRAFLIFQERVERMPEQVLRFYRLPGVEEPEPLWISAVKIPATDIPPCSLCGGPRQIEFQLLSTLLNYLDNDDFQFDSLLFYTCQSNCEIAQREGGKSGWAEEVVAALEFGKEGVHFPTQP